MFRLRGDLRQRCFTSISTFFLRASISRIREPHSASQCTISVVPTISLPCGGSRNCAWVPLEAFRIEQIQRLPGSSRASGRILRVSLTSISTDGDTVECSMVARLRDGGRVDDGQEHAEPARSWPGGVDEASGQDGRRALDTARGSSGGLSGRTRAPLYHGGLHAKRVPSLADRTPGCRPVHRSQPARASVASVAGEVAEMLMENTC